MDTTKVGEHEAEVIHWLNFLPEDDLRAITDVRDFYGFPSIIEEAKQTDQVEQLNKMWEEN